MKIEIEGNRLSIYFDNAAMEFIARVLVSAQKHLPEILNEVMGSYVKPAPPQVDLDEKTKDIKIE